VDQLAGLQESVIVPAREIIHDIMVPLFHPLIGVSPIFACGLAAIQGLKIAQNTMALFANGSQPGGIITAPHHIPPDVAERARKHWEANYAGPDNIGRVAILGDSMSYTPVTMTAVDAQLIDQLNWGDLRICGCFHVPPYMIGIGPAPPYTDIQSINLQYYTQALQNPIENIETLLDEGLEFPSSPEYHAEFDLSALLRMDTKTQVENATKGILGGLFAPNEGRSDFDLKRVPGGDNVMLQQQMFSLEALAARDAGDPFAVTAPERITAPGPAPTDTPKPAPAKALDIMTYRRTVLARTKALADAAA
jgi:HK97 family phage portal protein